MKIISKWISKVWPFQQMLQILRPRILETSTSDSLKSRLQYWKRIIRIAATTVASIYLPLVAALLAVDSIPNKRQIFLILLFSLASLFLSPICFLVAAKVRPKLYSEKNVDGAVQRKYRGLTAAFKVLGLWVFGGCLLACSIAAILIGTWMALGQD